MKIGIITRHLDLPVGFGTYAGNLLAALAADGGGHQFVVYTPHAPSRLDWPDHFQLRLLPCPQVRSKLAYWEHMTAPRQAKRDGVDLIHYLHTANSIPLTGRPIIVNVLDAIGWVLPEYRLPLPYRLLAERDIRFASHVVTISESARADILRLLPVRPERASVTYLAGPPAEKRVKALKREKFFLCVGGLEKRKNVRAALAAFAAADFPGYRLKIVGPTNRSPITDTLSEVMVPLTDQQRGRVEWLGRPPHDDFVKLLRTATALVFPSRYEGFGLPPIEAMAYGTPVISSNVSSLPEVVGSAALTVDPDDVAGLSTAMQRVTRQPALVKRLAAAGRRQAASFTWQRTADETLRIYRKVAG